MSEKTLIAYYSYSGNTKAVAEKIKKLTGGDLFEIEPQNAYPANYNDAVNQAQREKDANFKPLLVNNGDVSDYDTIYLGTPVWWYTFASPIRTFLTIHDFTGKTIMPFCTHGGGWESHTFTEIQDLCPTAIVKQGFASYEKTARLPEIESWLRK